MFSTRKQPEDTPTVRLMKAMHFGGKDLDFNRASELSEGQKRQLHREFWGQMLWVSFFPLFFGVWFPSIYHHIPADQRASNPATYLMAIMILGMGIGFIYAVYQHYKNVSRAHVTVFTGRVRIYSSTREAGILIAINYADETEHFYTGGSAAFIDGETYQIYSLSYWDHKIISAEHVPSP
jgi:hypothetical protein